MRRLRAPQGGCPWDLEQSHASLRPNLLEEVYEALEAIESGDPKALAEELGDLLIQVVFHAQIGAEEGAFDIHDVVRGINEKLHRRHPHVFGDTQVADSAEVKVNWDRIKREEHELAGERERSILDGAATTMPALAYSHAIQERAARAGFDWESMAGVLEKVAEELRELESSPSPEEREQELGDLLFSVVNAARWMEIHAEDALRGANRRFYRRFTHMERLCRERGLDFAGMPMEGKEALWQEAKRAVG
ncbi:MAG: nucleoside triphosphate pyrophosphohydrolase [Chloroflexi bacterium]|nr:nucleoside triphosphate pyrophosphohydrolase [Chloroflexota bacterium]